jgi:NAD(P)-dependent dehydrogenase (short-subunit alcohol dehydrogenase family)
MKEVAIITAASKGMGAASARRLAADGYSTVLLARSEDVEVVAQEIGGVAFQGSVDSEEDLKSFVEFAMDKFGRIDVVVNNTGHSAKGELLSISDEEWISGFELLFLNVVRMARHVTPIMEKQGGGSIINISSFAALEPSLDFPVSSAIRAGLLGYVRLYADKYGAKSIRMNNILPGFIDSYPVNDDIMNKIPMARAGRVDEIAGVVSFLASEDSGYINGENIKVDGGISRSI